MVNKLIIVAPDRRNEWSVVEVGLDKPLSHFVDKDEAIDFALKIGRTRKQSHIKVCNEYGSTEAQFIFSARQMWRRG